MAITYGFFNSVNGDRVYNADTISRMFRGLLSDGVYQGLDGGFAVTAAGTGRFLNIASGRAIVDDRWVENDAAILVELAAANALLDRIDAIILRKSTVTRDVTLQILTGTPAAAPVRPAITRNGTTYDLLLAAVRVPAGAAQITAANVTDTRSDGSVCGWVTGLVDQVDTTALFSQFAAAYQENLDDMNAWEDEQKAAFEAWYDALTQELNVDTYVTSYEGTVITSTYGGQTVVDLPFTAAQFSAGDVLEVYANGVRMNPGAYTVDVSNRRITLAAEMPLGQCLHFISLKSVIGVA